MSKACETGIFTLTPLHCGTGQAYGAIDLPIAREKHTGFPFIPSTSLKGVLRDVAEDRPEGVEAIEKRDIEKAFGKRPPQPGDDEELTPANLVFTDACLLLLPVRALTRPFYWVTCPLAIRRWARTRRSLGLEVPEEASREAFSDDAKPCASFASHAGPLVLEDTVIRQEELELGNANLRAILQQWVHLLPNGADERAEILEATVCVTDMIFRDLALRATAVSARIQLTDGKTTGIWPGEDGKEQKGNLWYEETLPSDCLLCSWVTHREGKADSLKTASAAIKSKEYFQLGGNESVGQGLCWWSLES